MKQNDLIEFLLGSSLVVSKSDGGTIFVKGFASTTAVDVRGDIADPAGFTWDPWPQLLVDHWGSPVGNPLSINQATLKDIGSPDDWGVVDVKTGEQINTYPKAKVPTLKSGDVGLFVTAEVTQPEVIEKVKTGELGSFSWRGLARVLKGAVDSTVRFLTDIELFEISLVQNPANPQAAFVISKSLGDLNAVFDDLFPAYEEREMSKAQEQPEDEHPDLAGIFPEFLR